MAHHDDFTNKFHQLLGRLAVAHARLDFNVGLQLNWLGSHLDVEVAHLLDAKKVVFSKRLKKLRVLVMELFEEAGSDALDEFRRWFARAERLKAVRNDYVHGRWGSSRSEGPDGDTRVLTFVALHWDIDGPDKSVRITLSDLEKQVKQMESLTLQYFHLEEKYLTYAKPQKISVAAVR